ncbi:MAG: hypothetical protein II870_03445 [Synergistaceae bacterium]|nr:hypothetical protein [Synergistaceae bacterium]MBR0043800.1 hypothetical protein [Synergistaceae bacterium]MBR0220621.1 hypothetical protein [Synergistaceae bacterium]
MNYARASIRILLLEAGRIEEFIDDMKSTKNNLWRFSVKSLDKMHVNEYHF